MHGDKQFRLNFKIPIIITLIIINLTLFQCQSNDNGLSEKFTADECPESNKRHLAPTNGLNDSVLNSDVEDDQNTDPRELMFLYESLKLNHSSFINNKRILISMQMDTIKEIIGSIVDKENTTQTGEDEPQTQSSRVKCNITKEKLDNLQKEIKAILTNTTAGENNGGSKCTLDFDDTNNCNNVMKTIQCGFDHIRNAFLDALTNEGSAKEFAQLKNAYDKLKDEFEKEKEDLKQSLSQDYQLKLDQLTKIMQDLGSKLNQALEKLEKNTGDLCVIEIVGGIITEAVDHFKQLTLTSMSEIVTRAYNFNKKSSPEELNRVAYIAEFLARLPEKGKADALKTFFKRMKEMKHLNSVRVLILNYSYIKSEFSDSEITKEIEPLIDRYVADFIDVISYNRKNSVFSQFINLYCGNFFNAYSHKIYDSALIRDNPKERVLFKNIIDSINNFPYYDQTVDGLSHVNDFMVKRKLENHNTLKLIYYVNELTTKLEKKEKTKLVASLIKKLENIIEKLPGHAVNIVSKVNRINVNCQIKNRAYPDEYLEVDTFRMDLVKRKSFLWRLNFPPTGYGRTGSRWRLESTNNFDSFTIKHVGHDEYLYGVNNTDAKADIRPICTWKHQDPIAEQAYWEFAPRNEGQYFTLRNVFYQEYLYAHEAPSRDNKSRDVFCYRYGKPGGDMWKASYWEIICY
ncbi:uncharacterized protein LOC123298401 [Chrysoperla carnea]|uniref:uncharacterized protein LOC123298401 n=1 Tax=Chrysoperla carnea TaxID=189513 RepID=UPI001D095185|nr:uncharacterized protein LOC123298401 [Chrysoperla carnea]XP_044736330.1 uncharacterized protein LOC123298401 [Chrysoperla carnea]